MLPLVDLPDSVPDMSRQPADRIVEFVPGIPSLKRPELWDDYSRQLAELNSHVRDARSFLLGWAGMASAVVLLCYFVDIAGLLERTGLWLGLGKILGFGVILMGAWPGLLAVYAWLERSAKRADLRHRREAWHAEVARYYANFQAWRAFSERSSTIVAERRRQHQIKVDANAAAWEAHKQLHVQNRLVREAQEARLAAMEKRLLTDFPTFAVQEDFDGTLPPDELRRRYRQVILSHGEEAGLLRLSKNPLIRPMIGDGAFLPPAPLPPIEPPSYTPPYPDLQTPSFYLEERNYRKS